MTVEQAKADLGITDEKDLLNLPGDIQEDIKNGLVDDVRHAKIINKLNSGKIKNY